jgi:hypothetical protein
LPPREPTHQSSKRSQPSLSLPDLPQVKTRPMMIQDEMLVLVCSRG